MAQIAQYKKYNRGKRQASVETDFSSGMMFSEGAVNDGYVKTLVNFDFTTDGRNALKPRAGLRTREFILPDISMDDPDFLSEDTAIKYSKECYENGNVFYQIILGKTNTNSLTEGKIWVITAPKAKNEVQGDDDYSVFVTPGTGDTVTADAMFYNSEHAEIHEVALDHTLNTSFPVGAFLGNSFYYFNTDGELRHTVFDSINEKYKFADLNLKEPTASEAVQYGYNMLLESPYEFSNKYVQDVFMMEGILPYNSASGIVGRELLMNPRQNSKVHFECYYDVISSNTYNIVWSWKELSADEWITFKTITNWTSGATKRIEASLTPPSKDILVRCEAYRVVGGTADEVVETAMTVGFDFSIDDNDSTLNVEQVNYDLSTSTGMYSWKNRLVLWGVPASPNVLFISDIDEPDYFPYPNNVEIFDEPIVSAVELMDNLMVFTTNKIYQVSFDSEGTGWTTTVIQSNLYIDAWDKHLIQSVRNMLYFKSGNYYYMLVPKAQSTTGELTVAPITTPITDFFNRFSVNIEAVFRDCFRVLDGGEVKTFVPTSLITYFNYLDYEFIHNVYVYEYLPEENDYKRYVHFDIMYNTVNRYWKISVYEAPHLLYPFRNDSTQQGLLASSSLVSVRYIDSDEHVDRRIVQLFEHTGDNIEDLYLTALGDFALDYGLSHGSFYVVGEDVGSPSGTYSNQNITFDSSFVRESSLKKQNLEFIGNEQYLNGFNILELADQLPIAQDYIREHMIFKNKQMLDTGYRDAGMFINKRYRELQLQINNMDNVDMEFGMDFKIAGEPRNTEFKYEVSQVIDEMIHDYGIAYIEATPYMTVDYEDVDKANLWTLKHSLNSDVSLWKVRASVSGKGAAPRLRLFTKNQFNYQLLGVNWVYREMNMR